jgi:hypothetical protein
VRGLLLTLTAVEIVIFLGALVVYLVRIIRSLRTISLYLGKVTFGVRAIETQTAPIGPSVVRINGQLEGIAAALAGVAQLAEHRADRS